MLISCAPPTDNQRPMKDRNRQFYPIGEGCRAECMHCTVEHLFVRCSLCVTVEMCFVL